MHCRYLALHTLHRTTRMALPSFWRLSSRPTRQTTASQWLLATLQRTEALYQTALCRLYVPTSLTAASLRCGLHEVVCVPVRSSVWYLLQLPSDDGVHSHASRVAHQTRLQGTIYTLHVPGNTTQHFEDPNPLTLACMHTLQFIYDSSDGLPLTPGAVTASASSGTATLTFSFAGDRGVPLTHYQVRQFSPCSSDNITIIQTVGAPSAVNPSAPVRQCASYQLATHAHQTPLCFCPPNR